MSYLAPRDTCLTCQLNGVETKLIFNHRGGHCPKHGALFLEELRQNARQVLGLPDPKTFIPAPRPPGGE
jgi:hypothetical protein